VLEVSVVTVESGVLPFFRAPFGPVVVVVVILTPLLLAALSLGGVLPLLPIVSVVLVLCPNPGGVEGGPACSAGMANVSAATPAAILIFLIFIDFTFFHFQLQLSSVAPYHATWTALPLPALPLQL
jgi:hypothetical protein